MRFKVKASRLKNLSWWIPRRRDPVKPRVYCGSMSAAIDGDVISRPRGATLPLDQQPLAYDHTGGQARRMTALETARWLRECAEKKGKPWPLA